MPYGMEVQVLSRAHCLAFGQVAFRVLTGPVHSLGILFHEFTNSSMSLAKLQVFASHFLRPQD